MERLSERMRAAGWVLQSAGTDLWEMISPEGRRFSWKHGEWSPPREEAEQLLLRDEIMLREGKRSPYLGTARLLRCARPGEPTLLARRIAEKGLCRDRSVLRGLTLPDPVGDALLLEAGARRVETLLAPWGPAPSDSRRFPHHLLLCEHLCDVLPATDRHILLHNLPGWLHAQGEVFISFYEMSAMPPADARRDFEDGYLLSLSGHELFLKPWLPARALDFLQREIGGSAAHMWSLYDEFVLRWFPES